MLRLCYADSELWHSMGLHTGDTLQDRQLFWSLAALVGGWICFLVSLLAADPGLFGLFFGLSQLLAVVWSVACFDGNLRAAAFLTPPSAPPPQTNSLWTGRQLQHKL